MALTFEAPRSPFLIRFIIVQVLYEMNPAPLLFDAEGIGDSVFTVGGGVSLAEFNGGGAE